MITVLITGCNNHFMGIERCLHNNYEKEQVFTIGTDCNPNHLLGVGCDRTYAVPRSDSRDYIPRMLEICKENHVDVILPFVTSELHVMAENAKKFEAIGTKVSVASPEAINKANNKISLYESFSEYMPFQKIVKSSAGVDEFAKEIGYPDVRMCCKIPESCGGNGFAVIDEKLGRDIRYRNKCGVAGYITLDTLKELTDNYNGCVIMSEYVQGNDYSVCALTDHGEVTHMCGYIGYEMDYGCVLLGEIMKNDMAYEITRDVCKRLKIDGNVCVDFMLKKDGSVKMLEVNPRVSASLAFVAAAGLNLPYLRCKQLLGTDITKYDIDIKYGLKMRKYYECEYI